MPDLNRRPSAVFAVALPSELMKFGTLGEPSPLPKLLENSHGCKFKLKQNFQTPIYSSLELVTVQLPKVYFQAESVDFRISGTILLLFLKLNCSVT